MTRRQLTHFFMLVMALVIYLFGWNKKKLSCFDKSAVWLIQSHQKSRGAFMIIYKHGTENNH